MLFLEIAIIVLVIFFGAVVFLGAPYLPSLHKNAKQAIICSKFKKGQTLVDLGCGDGKVLLIAEGIGLSAVGYELNPILYLIAKYRTRKHKKIKVIFGNYWTIEIKNADIFYAFLDSRFMKKLDTKISKNSSRPVKLISIAYPVPGKKSLIKGEGFFIYEYK